MQNFLPELQVHTGLHFGNNSHCSFGLGLFLQVIVLRNGHSGENAEDDQDGNDFNEREALLSPVLSHRIPPSTNVKKRLKPERKNHMYEARDRIFFIYRVPRDSSKGLRYPRTALFAKYPSCFLMKVSQRNGAALNKTAYKKIIPLYSTIYSYIKQTAR